MRSIYRQNRMIESLEGRQFLSVSPLLPPVTHVPVVHVSTPTAAPSMTNLVGSYGGTVAVTVPGLFTNKTFPASIVVKSTTKTSLTGVINLGGIGGTGTFSGSVDAKGNFAYTVPYKLAGLNLVVNITGHVTGSKAGLTGNYSVTRAGRSLLTGTFTLSRK